MWILVILSSRVFKYANKGYGIRILPGYLEALKTINPAELPEVDSYGTWKDEAILDDEKQFSLEARIANAREYFERFFGFYMRWPSNGRDLQPSYVENPWKGTPLWPTGQALPVFTHALLDTHGQPTSQTQPQSCLTGFELLYRCAFGCPCTHIFILFRHVALWEAEQAGRLTIQDDVWASSSVSGFSSYTHYSISLLRFTLLQYEEVVYGVSYEETPKCVSSEITDYFSTHIVTLDAHGIRHSTCKSTRSRSNIPINANSSAWVSINATSSAWETPWSVWGK